MTYERAAPGRDLVPCCHAARAWGVHPRTVRRWIAIGAVRGERRASFVDGRAHWYVCRDELDRVTRGALQLHRVTVATAVVAIALLCAHSRA